MILIDTLNIVFITFYIAIKKLKDEGKEFNEENLPFFYHLFINKIHLFFTTYGKLDFCWEGKNSTSWRKSIYSEYKANRSENNNKEEYILLKSIFPKIRELLSYYPCRNLEVENAEADDVMYQLAIKEGSHTILTTDKDLSQIKLINKDVEIYNPINKKYIEPSKTIIEEKIIIGDKSDNIPGLYRIGKKTFEKMMLDENFRKEKISGDNLKLYNIFKKIVDLSQIPKEIKENILDASKNTQYNEFKPDNIEVFFFENRLINQIHTWPQVKNEIRSKI
jgi:5'-3' exonuclease